MPIIYQRKPIPAAHIARLQAARLQREAEKAAKRRRTNNCFLYFLVCENYVKIGYARDPYQRCSAAQVGNPFEIRLAGLALGGKREETILHLALIKVGLHLRAEWFYFEPPLDHIVKTINELGAPEAARIWLGEWLFSLDGSTALLFEGRPAQISAHGIADRDENEPKLLINSERYST